MTEGARPVSSHAQGAGSCLVVMYHYVRDVAATPFPGIRALSPDTFARQLDWLQANYEIVDLARLDAALNDGPPLPPESALLTFDDGFVDHYETVFPALRSRGLSGVFFVSHGSSGPTPRLLGVHRTQFLLAALGGSALGRAVLAECELAASAGNSTGRAIFGADAWEEADDRAVKQLLNYQLPFADADRVLDVLVRRHLGDATGIARALYLDTAMIREMVNGGMTFGYHTRSHRMLSRLTADDQAAEIAPGVAWIRELTGQARVPFCYPWGGPQTYTSDTVRILADSGYSLAFNTVRRRLQVGVDGRFEIPRFDTRDLPPHTEADAMAAARTGEA